MQNFPNRFSEATFNPFSNTVTLVSCLSFPPVVYSIWGRPGRGSDKGVFWIGTLGVMEMGASPEPDDRHRLKHLYKFLEMQSHSENKKCKRTGLSFSFNTKMT